MIFSWLRGRRDKSPAYPLPAEGETIYAIGDIHGRSDLLDAIHGAIDAEMAARGGRAIEICLGDYVDRGPDSAGVIERLIRRSATRSLVTLRGNHEEMFAAFLGGEVEPEEWRPVGGLETLMSYGVDVGALAGKPRAAWVEAARARVPASHRAFLDGLVDFHRAGGYYFTHAGIRPGVALDEQESEDLLWIRDVFLGDERPHGAVVVHGHTPAMEAELLPNRINIDTGAYLTNRLTCLRIGADGLNLIATGPRPNA